METLLAVITILQRTGGKRLLVKLFSRLVLLFGLVITTAIMVGAVLVGGLMNAHIALLNHEISASVALLIIGGAALFIIAALLAVIAWQVRKLRRLPKAPPLMDMLDAFIAGLMAD